MRAALIYDFDGTLARGNIQERSFLRDLGIDPAPFWQEVMERACAQDADKILIYMQLMLEKARANGRKVTRSFLRKHGRDPEFFDGLCSVKGDKGWFERINAFARTKGLALSHFIISAGNKEMIEGCRLHDRFERVFASQYVFDDNDEAVWPGLSVNYTAKTQFLFRINKGIETVWDEREINRFVEPAERPIPFERMIYVGDGETDVPALKMVKTEGGASVAVYDLDKGVKGHEAIHQLIADDRVSFIAPADYTEGGQLDIIVKGLLGRMARRL